MLEKRLGIAQLCLLLAVLVFMGLTRGSRGETWLEHGDATVKLNKSMKEWSRRHLSFSGDWANRFRSRSPTPQRATRSPDLGKGEDSYSFFVMGCPDAMSAQTTCNFLQLYYLLLPQEPRSHQNILSRANTCGHLPARGGLLQQGS